MNYSESAMKSTLLKESYEDLNKRIQETCELHHRSPNDILLLAVSKQQEASKIEEAYQLGLCHFGENYAQEFLAHLAAIQVSPILRDDKPLSWHFIGHLQRNKVKQIIAHTHWIHSVDSLALAQEIDKRAIDIQKIQPILLEVKLAPEENKSGLPPEDLNTVLKGIKELKGLQCLGLMTIPPASADPEESRPFFKKLNLLKEELNQKKIYPTMLTQLSMGMSHDFEVAIQEGSTCIRIGTGLFGERKKI